MTNTMIYAVVTDEGKLVCEYEDRMHAVLSASILSSCNTNREYHLMKGEGEVGTWIQSYWAGLETDEPPTGDWFTSRVRE